MNFVFDTKVYQYDIMVSIDETPEQLRRALKKRWVTDFSGWLEDYLFNLEPTNTARTVWLVWHQIVLIIKTQKYKHNTIGTLAHEVFHIVTLIMNWVGIKYSSDSEEAYAYLTGYIMTYIIRKMWIK